MINDKTLGYILGKFGPRIQTCETEGAMKDIAYQCNQNQVAIEQIVDYLSAGDTEIAKKMNGRL